MSRTISPTERDIGKIAVIVSRLGRKRDGTVTFDAGTTTTTVTDLPLTQLSVIHLTPMTANAAAAYGTWYISARANGSFTLTHANNGQTDRTFLWAAVGD